MSADDPLPSAPDGTDIDHAGLEVLDGDACRALLSSTSLARVAFVDDDGPVVLPVNIGWWHGDVVFSTARGSKLDQATAGRRIALEADGWDAQLEVGWSVLVRGVGSVVTDGRDIDALDRMSVRSWVRPGVPKHWVSVRPEAISGRRTVPG